jgi:tetratricopeptide (TPR) repeat protein
VSNNQQTIELSDDADEKIKQALTNSNKLASQLVEEKKFFGAKAALCRALSSSPENFQLWANLSSVMWGMGAYDEALLCAQRSLDYNHHPEPMSRVSGLLSMGNVQMSLGKYREADKAFSEALKIDPDRRDAKWNLSLLNLLVGNYEKGWKNYHLRIEKDFFEIERDLPSKPWVGQSLAGRSIRILHDQGIGDTIMYSRFLEHGCFDNAESVYFSTVPQLVPLLWDFQDRGIQLLHAGAPIVKTDYHVHLGTIPAVLNLSLNEVPRPSKTIRNRVLADVVDHTIKVDIPEPQVKPALKIGLCWSGRPDFPRNKDRSVPLKTLCSLADSPFFWLYSLQVGPQSAEIAEIGMDRFIHDLSPQLDVWTHTALAIMKMDVVVTSCTSIAHLAGTLGVPTYVMLCKEPYWPWGASGEKTPWYPSVTLVRQKRWNDWGPVVDNVRTRLMRELGKKVQP